MRASRFASLSHLSDELGDGQRALLALRLLDAGGGALVQARVALHVAARLDDDGRRSLALAGGGGLGATGSLGDLAGGLCARECKVTGETRERRGVTLATLGAAAGAFLPATFLGAVAAAAVALAGALAGAFFPGCGGASARA